jgi:hypothetical protein
MYFLAASNTGSALASWSGFVLNNDVRLHAVTFEARCRREAGPPARQIHRHAVAEVVWNRRPDDPPVVSPMSFAPAPCFIMSTSDSALLDDLRSRQHDDGLVITCRVRARLDRAGERTRPLALLADAVFE